MPYTCLRCWLFATVRFLRRVLLSRTAIIGWTLSYASLALSILILGVEAGTAIGVVVGRLTWLPCIIAAIRARGA